MMTDMVSVSNFFTMSVTVLHVSRLFSSRGGKVKPVTSAKKQSKYAEWSPEALIAELEKRDKGTAPHKLSEFRIPPVLGSAGVGITAEYITMLRTPTRSSPIQINTSQSVHAALRKV